MTQSQTAQKSYSNFNTVSFQGRILNVDVVEGQYGEFAAITVISNMEDDTPVTIEFNNSNGMLGLYRKGWLPNGRQVTVTGRLCAVSEVYTNKDGELQIRKRPLIKLDSKTVQMHTGAMPKDSAPARPAAGTKVIRRNQTQAPAEAPSVDPTPAVTEEAPF